jgi:hypothetical protein
MNKNSIKTNQTTTITLKKTTNPTELNTTETKSTMETTKDTRTTTRIECFELVKEEKELVQEVENCTENMADLSFSTATTHSTSTISFEGENGVDESFILENDFDMRDTRIAMIGNVDSGKQLIIYCATSLN